MNKTWLVKELSELTKISVRTLHHYDNIGLLTPAVRRENGYRVYSEQDVIRLQHIVALKYLGFSLEKIGSMLEDGEIKHHLAMQKALLEEKKQSVEMMLRMIEHSLLVETIDTEKILDLIVGFKTGIDAAQNWQNAYSKEELDAFKQADAQYTEQEKADYAAAWQDLVARVKAHMNNDPAAPESIKIAREWHALVEKIYGDKPELKAALTRVRSQGKMPDAFGGGGGMMSWIAAAKKAAGLDDDGVF